MWDSPSSSWSDANCVTENNATDKDSVTCKCSEVGSYSVIVRAVVSDAPAPTTTGTGSSAVSVRDPVMSVLVTVGIALLVGLL